MKFATCVRSTALKFLQEGYPSYKVTDTEVSAKNLLDLVEKDIIRITDPAFHRLAIIPGNFHDSENDFEIIEVSSKFHKNPGDLK